MNGRDWLTWALLASLAFPELALAYRVCQVEGPAQKADSCFVHFGEGKVDLDANAERELIRCLESLNWARELELIGHADACTQDLASALALSDRRYVTSMDTGNSILGETRVDKVSAAIGAARQTRGYGGSMYLSVSNQADSGSSGHDADDRTVEIRARDSKSCDLNYVFDGSGSMAPIWPTLSSTQYPLGSCFHIIVSDGVRCPAALKDYRPYGSTQIYDAVANQFLDKKNVVILSDFQQPDARKDDRDRVNAAIKSGKIKYWKP